jgi:hypothetical protein
MKTPLNQSRTVDVAKCPRFKEPGEDTTQLLRYQNPTVNDPWEAALKTLHEWMDEQDSDPYIAHPILSSFKRWRTGEENSYGHTEQPPNEAKCVYSMVQK